MRYFEILEHEADVGLSISGKTLEELFKNAALALFSLITDIEHVEATTTRNIYISGDGGLLIVFLNELLYVLDTERFLVKDLSVSIEGERLEACVQGEIFDEKKHTMRMEIKAVTYHGFSIEKERDALKARVILDI